MRPRPANAVWAFWHKNFGKGLALVRVWTGHLDCAPRRDDLCKMVRRADTAHEYNYPRKRGCIMMVSRMDIYTPVQHDD